MNAPIEFETAKHYSIPAQFRSLLKPPRLSPGESQTDYATVRQMMVDEVAPQSSIEWLWTIDLIELSWDVFRYRSLREKVLEVHREAVPTPGSIRPFGSIRAIASQASKASFQSADE
jgi:hypothetical protein